MIDGPRSLDKAREEIIKHNLVMMNTKMMSLLNLESIGGNAGVAQSQSGNLYNSAAANGYIDNEGRIVAFGNLQNIPQGIRDNASAFSFHVAFDSQLGVHKIIYLDNKSNIEANLMQVLRDSVTRFNVERK